MLINKITWEWEEKREIYVSKEKYSKQYDWVLILEDCERYVVITMDSCCFLDLQDEAFINSNIKIEILWFRKDRLHQNSQLVVYRIRFIKDK